MEDAQRSHTQEGPGNGRLWLGASLPVLGWGLHLFVSYGFVEWYCQNPGVMSNDAAIWLLLGVTAVSLALAVCGALLSWNSGKRLRIASEQGRKRFMAASGVLLGVFMIVIIITQALPNAMVPPCI